VVGRTVQGLEAGEEEVIAFVNSRRIADHIANDSHAMRNLAPLKQPSQIILVPEMPVTANGKGVRRTSLPGWRHPHSLGEQNSSCSAGVDYLPRRVSQ